MENTERQSRKTIVFFAPNQKIYQDAKAVLQEEKAGQIGLELINTQSIVAAAKNAVRAGAEILISRGTQAKIIRENASGHRAGGYQQSVRGFELL